MALQRSRSRVRLEGVSHALMPLESRALLAVDFGIESPTQPNSLTTAAFGEYLTVPVRVTRAADPGDEVLSHAVSLYFSLDEVLDSEDVRADVVRFVGADQDGEAQFLGEPTGEYSGPLAFRVPLVPSPGSTYRIILKISGVSAQGGSDPNSANDVVVSPDTLIVVNKFGSFDGRVGVALTLPNPSAPGDVVFTIDGAGQGEVSLVNGRFAVHVSDTDLNSEVNVFSSGYSTPTAPRFPVGALVVDDAIGSFLATSSDITGPITLLGSVRYLALGDVTGPLDIDVPVSSDLTFSARHVRDVNITAHSKLGVSVNSWQVTNPSYGLISAPRIAGIDVANWGNVPTSSPDYRAPNFAGRIIVTGDSRSYLGRSVGYISIAGVVTGGNWSVKGGIGSINVGSTAAQFVLASDNGVDDLRVTNSLRGIIAVQYLSNINVGKDMLNAKLLIGTDLGTDAAIGGVGDAADRYLAGRIFSLTVGRNVVNSLVAVGRKPVGDSGLYEIVQGYRSRIDTVQIANVLSLNSRIQAGAIASFGGSVTVRGASIDWRTDARFSISVAPPSVTLLSSRVLTRSVLMGVQVVGAVPIAQAAPTGAFFVTNAAGVRVGRVSVASVYEGDIFDGNSYRVVIRFTRRDAAAFMGANNGMYTLSLVAGKIADNRGNTAVGGVLGTFTISV